MFRLATTSVPSLHSTTCKRLFHPHFPLWNSLNQKPNASAPKPPTSNTEPQQNAPSTVDRSIEDLFAKDFPNLSKLKKESPQVVQILNAQKPVSVDMTWNTKYIPTGALVFYLALLTPAVFCPILMSNVVSLASLQFVYGFSIKYTNLILFTGAATHVALAFAGYGPHSFLRKFGSPNQKTQMERLDQEMREKGTNNQKITEILDSISLNPYSVNSKSAILRYFAAFFFAILCGFSISFPYEDAATLPILYTVLGNLAMLLFDSAMTRQGLAPYWYFSLKAVVVGATVIVLVMNYLAYTFYKPSHDKKLFETMQKKETEDRIKRKVGAN